MMKTIDSAPTPAVHRAPAHGVAPRRRPAGFTLIEVVLGIALMALLMGGIFAVARGALQVSSEVTGNQQYSMKIHSFLELLRRTFEEMPGNGQVTLLASGRGYESEVAFREFPLAFSWAGVPAGSPAVVLKTIKGGSGWLQSRVYYLNEEQAEAYAESQRLDESGLNLLLMDQMKMLQWRFYDQQTDEWVTEWDNTATRPSLIELNVEFLDGSDPLSVIYWIPTVVNPEQIARSTQTAPGGGAGTPGAGAGPGGGGGRGGRGEGGDARGGGRDGQGGGRGNARGAGGGRGGGAPRGGGGNAGRPQPNIPGGGGGRPR